jgi:phage shock protein C
MTANPTTPFAGPDAGPRPEVRRLHRSRSNRVLAGVCGGIAEDFGSDPTAVRLVTAVLGLFTGIFPMLLLYLVAALIVPESDEASPRFSTSGAAAVAPGPAALVFGALLILVGIAGFANEWIRIDWERIWPFVLMGLGVLVVVMSRRH